jgi:hypothetical protein
VRYSGHLAMDNLACKRDCAAVHLIHALLAHADAWL